MFASLSGRFLILTIIFVMLAEVLIFVPSIARFRADYLTARLERAQIAALAREAGDMMSMALETELLKTAEVFNVVLRRNELRQLALSGPLPGPVVQTFDLRNASAFALIRDAFARLMRPEQEVIRVIGDPVQGAGVLIEITLPAADLHMAMVEYGKRILWLSAAISIITGMLLFFAVRRVIVVPIRIFVQLMQNYTRAPEDMRNIISVKPRVTEFREVMDSLYSLQTRLTSALKQKEHLAQLGAAVAKISHDLRNILTSAQLFTDRIEMSEDPTVRRLAPKLVNSITRAVSLCETTLRYGRAEEAAPTLGDIRLDELVAEVLESERLAATDTPIVFRSDVATGFTIHADAEQMYRVLTNLVRNARQALQGANSPAPTVTVSAGEAAKHWTIQVTDTGPGLPPKAQENLFTAFQGAARKGGVGLGLAISAELMRGHGGKLRLDRSDAGGTQFTILCPKPTPIF